MPSSLSMLLFRDAQHLMADGRFEAAPLVMAEVCLDAVPASVEALADPERLARIVIDRRRRDAASVD